MKRLGNHDVTMYYFNLKGENNAKMKIDSKSADLSTRALRSNFLTYTVTPKEILSAKGFQCLIQPESRENEGERLIMSKISQSAAASPIRCGLGECFKGVKAMPESNLTTRLLSLE